MVLVVAVAYVLACLFLPLRSIKSPLTSTTLTIATTPSPQLNWPPTGEAAVGMMNSGVIATNGPQKALPTASVAKLITALAVLSKYPLSPGQSGPTIILDTTDYNYYTTYVAEQGSVVPIYTGEQLSELDMLEAMLIPSGNNIADSLARWAFGSISNYTNFANQMVKRLGLSNTHVAGDASGYLPTTTSTPSDLIKLGELVMLNPVLKTIVGMKSVNIPNVGILSNYDNILGSYGIIGIKTGNSNQAGGVFLGAATVKQNTKSVVLLTAVMDAPNLFSALSETEPLISTLENSFTTQVIIHKGEVLGSYVEPWGGRIQYAAKTDLSLTVLEGQSIKIRLSLNPLKPDAAVGTVVGSVASLANPLNATLSEPVVTLKQTTQPSRFWRLLHPQYLL